MNLIRSKPLLLVLALCIVLRVGVLLAFPSVFAFDQTGSTHGSDAYDAYARNLLTTGVYGRTPGVPDAAIPPLYSYVLAAVYAVFGRGYIQVGLFHTLLDVLSILMLYEIGKRLMPRDKHPEIVALLAALFYAVYPYLIFQNLTLIDTPLFIALLHAFVLLMVLLREHTGSARAKWLLAGLGGLALGLAMLARPVIAPLALFVAIWFLFRLNFVQTVARLLPVGVVCALVLAPWIAHNYTVYNAFVPVATNGGMNFWFGNSQYTIPFLRAGFHPQWATPERKLDNLDSREANAVLFDLSFQFLRQNPDKIPELLWVKFLAYWSIDVFPTRNPVSGMTPIVDYNGRVRMVTDPNGAIDLNGVPQNDPVAAYSQPLFDQIGRMIHRLYYGALFLLALVGIGLTRQHWRAVSLLWFVQICMTVVYVVFIPATRYRVPTDPMLFLFSAQTLVAAWEYVRARRAVQIRAAAS
jgi:4-amino-4-deoxy-L-arabinose transferase-like glycosyltransferase